MDALKQSRAIGWAISDMPVDYPAALAAMTARAAAIRKADASELVWLLQHPPLITAGTSAKREDLLEPDRFPVFGAGRGGQFTYHGPGQRVGYLMLDMRARGGDVRGLIDGLERWIILTLADFNIRGVVFPGRVGVWVKRPGSDGGEYDKIAAIGLRVSAGVTTHGVSLNVEPDLSHFSAIVPCGIRDAGVTSLAALGLPVTMTDADVALRRNFETVFGPTGTAAPPAAARGGCLRCRLIR